MAGMSVCLSLSVHSSICPSVHPSSYLYTYNIMCVFLYMCVYTRNMHVVMHVLHVYICVYMSTEQQQDHLYHTYVRRYVPHTCTHMHYTYTYLRTYIATHTYVHYI